MNLDDDYQYILALAKTGSLSGAAKQLSVTHTTVARRIQAFEAHFNVRLFERVPKGYQLTPTGAQILPDIQQLKNQQLHIERQLIGQNQSLYGEVNLTLTPELAHDYVIPTLPEFYHLFPNIKLNLMMSTGHKDLYAREADIALRFTPEPTQANLIGKKLFASAWGVYASQAYLEAPPKQHKLLAWALEFDNEWHSEHFDNAKAIAQFDNLDALIAATKAGIGVAKLPCGLADQSRHSELRRLDLTINPSIWSLWMLYHYDLKSTAKVTAVKDFLFEKLLPLQSRFAGEESTFAK